MKRSNEKWVELKTPRLMPLRDYEMNDAQRKLLYPFKKVGKMPNSLSTMARSPKMMSRWVLFAAYILRGSAIPPREREMLILRTTWLCGSEYEFAQHAMVALSIGLTDSEIRRIMRRDTAEWEPFDAMLMRAVDELHSDACLSDTVWDYLKQQYNEKQMIDLIMIVGQYILLSLFTNTIGVPLDKAVPRVTLP